MLEVLTINESLKWDDIVKSFKEYDVYYLSGYVKAFQIHGGGEPLLFFYEDDKCRGINVVMKRDIALDKHFKGKLEIGKYFDFATPYGYGGWLIEGNDSSRLFDEYEKTLPRKQAYLQKVLYYINEYGRVALTCFEKNVEMCHRTRIKNYILNNLHKNLKVVEL